MNHGRRPSLSPSGNLPPSLIRLDSLLAIVAVIGLPACVIASTLLLALGRTGTSSELYRLAQFTIPVLFAAGISFTFAQLDEQLRANEGTRFGTALLNRVTSLTIAVVMATSGLILTITELRAGADGALGVPVWFPVAAIPLGFSLLATQVAWGSQRTLGPGTVVLTLGIAAAIALHWLEPSLWLLAGLFVVVALAWRGGLPLTLTIAGVGILSVWYNSSPLIVLTNESMRLLVSEEACAVALLAMLADSVSCSAPTSRGKASIATLRIALLALSAAVIAGLDITAFTRSSAPWLALYWWLSLGIDAHPEPMGRSAHWTELGGSAHVGLVGIGLIAIDQRIGITVVATYVLIRLLKALGVLGRHAEEAGRTDSGIGIGIDALRRYCVGVGYVAGGHVIIIAIVGAALIGWTDHLPSRLPSLAVTGNLSDDIVLLTIGCAGLSGLGYLLARTAGTVAIVTGCAIAAFAASMASVSPWLALGTVVIGAGTRYIELRGTDYRRRALAFVILGVSYLLVRQIVG